MKRAAIQKASPAPMADQPRPVGIYPISSEAARLPSGRLASQRDT
jgi:hypothetical protein